MNIFYLDSDPEQCAKWMVDKHVVKMILESAQLLSTAHRILDGVPYQDTSKTGRKVTRYMHTRPELYQATHINHPSCKWARESLENYQWLSKHFAHLMDEYFFRFGKRHACEKMHFLFRTPINIPNARLTKMPCAMDQEYIISDDPIINYRNYYKFGKVHLHKWTNREPPNWIK
jgi:Pyrimidine dimer DNA glycosylase